MLWHPFELASIASAVESAAHPTVDAVGSRRANEHVLTQRVVHLIAVLNVDRGTSHVVQHVLRD